jgi:hypothetical protein
MKRFIVLSLPIKTKPTSTLLLLLHSLSTTIPNNNNNNQPPTSRSNFFNKQSLQPSPNITTLKSSTIIKLPPKATSAIESLRQGFEILKKQNPSSTLLLKNRGNEVIFQIISVKTAESITISATTVDDNDGILLVNFPFGAPRRYHFSTDMQAWIGLEKGEDLFGLITRDILPHVIGVPNFKN